MDVDTIFSLKQIICGRSNSNELTKHETKTDSVIFNRKMVWNRNVASFSRGLNFRFKLALMVCVVHSSNICCHNGAICDQIFQPRCHTLMLMTGNAWTWRPMSIIQSLQGTIFISVSSRWLTLKQRTVSVSVLSVSVITKSCYGAPNDIFSAKINVNNVIAVLFVWSVKG